VTIASISSAQDEYDYNWDSWSEEEAFFMGLGLTMCIMIVIIPLVIAILACIWIYKDAEKRGKSGGLWVLILILASLFFSFLGLIIVIIVWLVIRPPIGGESKQVSSTERRCPNCGRVIPDDARTCPYCSKKFEV
jgi:Na+/H+-dicarboxylate symporter